MNHRTRPFVIHTKPYAMRRMAIALERAIAARSPADQERASRWAAAWGFVAGIFGKGIRLKNSDVLTRRAGGQRRHGGSGTLA
jgi:hypothetical protein